MENSITYKLLGKVNYKGNEFNIYRDKKYRKFYLKIIKDNNFANLMYPTWEEYNELNKIFGMNYIKDIETLIKQKNSGSKLSDKKIVKFIPKVITKVGLLTILTAIKLCGDELKSGSISTQIISQITDENLLEYRGYSIEKIEDGIYALNKVTVDEDTYIMCRNVDELKKELGLEGIPTYDDLLNAIKNNENISGRYEEWFCEAISNLSHNEEFKDVDFSVLLYNIQRMKIEEKTSEEIIERAENDNVVAFYEPATQKVGVNPNNVTKYIFLHEALGHASTQLIVDNIHYESNVILSIVDRNSDGSMGNIDAIFIGSGLEEGKADLLTEISLNFSEKAASVYDIEKETFREYKETLRLSWADIINNSMTLKIITEMKKIGIENPIEYIDNSDILHNANASDKLHYGELEDEVKFKNNVGNFLIEYSGLQIDAGRTKEDVVAQISQMIQLSDAYPYEIGVRRWYPVDDTNMQEFEEYVIDSIEKLPDVDNKSKENNEIELEK